VTALAGTSMIGQVRPEASGADLIRALAPLLERAAGRGRRMLVSLTLATAPRDPIELYAAAQTLGEVPTMWLRPCEGFGLVGIGAAWTARTSGPDRFRSAAEAWAGLTDGAFVRDDADGSAGTGPLLLGGFPFAPGDARHDPAWRGFERSALVLPRLMLTIGPEGAWLTANVVTGPDADSDADGLDGDATARAREIGELWDGLRAAAPSVPLTPASEPLRIAAEAPEAAWRATVVRFAGAVGRGRVDKVVLARRVDLVAEGPLDIPSALRRLEASAPESTVFAVTRRGRTFLGATPERLARTEGREFRTVAMAGSIGRGADEAEDERLAAELLASDKDREEHRVVVEMLRETLGSIAARLEVGRDPSVVRLRHVQHLVTELSGRLRERAGILALVERLHPTPAVGGQPRDLALELIDEQERLDRGWYAGPLGWLDRRGDGEFVVAIRSGVVDGAMASLFAGCGIMADSDPAREWEESRMKLRSLASALGRLEW
jgi:isochorismate synthase